MVFRRLKALLESSVEIPQGADIHFRGGQGCGSGVCGSAVKTPPHAAQARAQGAACERFSVRPSAITSATWRARTDRNVDTWTGFWTFLRSRVIFLTHGKGDVRPWPLNPSQKLIVNLWHGTHLKQVSVPMKEYSALIVSSPFEKKISYQAFGSSSSNYWLTGTPRTDILLKQAKSVPDDKIILYAPTWREEQIQDEEGKKGAKIFPLKNFNIKELVDLLDKHDAKLLFRWHNNDLIDEKSQELYDCTKISDRLILAGPEQYPDVQKLLLKSSILITDYSTLMHDFLLLDRPIIFFPYDYETYIRERGFYYDYNLFTPGPKIDSHSDFIKILEKFLLNPQAGSKWRHLVSDIMFPQKDGMSSERIMNKVSDIIFQEK